MITEVENAGKASLFVKVAEGGRNVVNKFKDFVKDPDGKLFLKATAALIVGAAIVTAGVAGQNNMEFLRTAVHYLSTFGMHAGEVMAGVGGTTTLISGITAGVSLSDYKKKSSER